MSDGGKGSKARPIEVSSQTYSDNWERTFSKTSCKETISGCANDDCSGISDCLVNKKQLVCPVCAAGGIACTGCLG